MTSSYFLSLLFSDEDTDTSYVKFLDYGGFAYIENSKLRQIRGDFMLLPFQAAECVLANIKSVNGKCLKNIDSYILNSSYFFHQRMAHGQKKRII